MTNTDTNTNEQCNDDSLETELPDSPSAEEFEERMDDPSYDASEQEEPETAPQERIKELDDQLLRMAAEMQNLRTRTKKEVEDARKYAISGFAENLISVLENLRRAQESSDSEELEPQAALENLREGIDLTAGELIKTFERHGIERVDPLGEAFNHDFHQALVQIPTNEFEAGKVAQVMAAGYKFKDRLLRPAMVGVAIAAPEVPAEEENAPAADLA